MRAASRASGTTSRALAIRLSISPFNLARRGLRDVWVPTGAWYDWRLHFLSHALCAACVILPRSFADIAQWPSAGGLSLFTDVIRCSSSLYFVYQFGPCKLPIGVHIVWCPAPDYCMTRSSFTQNYWSSLERFRHAAHWPVSWAAACTCIKLTRNASNCMCWNHMSYVQAWPAMTCSTPLVYQTSCWKAGMKYIITGAQMSSLHMSSLHITRAK